MRILVTFTLVLAAIIFMSHASGAGAEQAKDRTGGPVADGFCSACHSGGDFNTAVALNLFGPDGDTVKNYVPGTTYTMRVDVTADGASGFGFQAVALGSDLASIGTYGTPEAGSRITEVDGRDYFEHNTRSASGAWEIDWTAPEEGSGDIKFYFAGNAVNGNGSRTGDRPVHDSLIIAQDQTSSFDVASALSITMGPVPAIDNLHIEWSNNTLQPTELQVVSSVGELMLSRAVSPGSQSFDLDVHNLTAGIHMLIIQSSEGTASRKFVKL